MLAQIGLVPDQVFPADIDETPRPEELPRLYAQRMAREKAARVAAIGPGGLILAADTVVAVGRRILPKAETEAETLACLRLLSGRRHHVITSVVLSDAQHTTSRTVDSVVAFSRLTPRQIADYLAGGEWRGKAGGYAAQGRAASFVRFLSGSYSNVVGLPLFETAQLLRGRGLLA